MATKEHKLAIETRTKLGTTGAQALRREGKVPAVLYGHGTQPQHLAIDARALEDVLHAAGRTSVLTLTSNGKKSDTAMVREIARHQVSRKISHVDLQRVSAHEEIHTKLPVIAEGTPIGVRDFGGVLDVVVHELEVSGPIDELPESLIFDVSALNVHDHVTAGQFKLGKNIKLLTPEETLVISVEASKTAQLVEEAEAEAAASATPEQVQPEVIGEEGSDEA